jgi:hypothetical protein
MNSTMVREIRGAKINPKSPFKNKGAQNTRGRKLRSKYGILFNFSVGTLLRMCEKMSGCFTLFSFWNCLTFV